MITDSTSRQQRMAQAAMTEAKAFLDRILQDMAAAGIKKQELADYMGVSTPTVTKLGNVGNCSLVLATQARRAVNRLMQSRGVEPVKEG